MEEYNQEIKNLNTALRLIGFNFQNKHLEMFWEIQKALNKKGGELTLGEICEIEANIEAKYKAPENQKTED